MNMMKKIVLIAVLAMSMASVSAQNWYQYGFKIVTSCPIERQYSFDGDYLSGLRNADFGIFFRAGKYVYGEVGFGYTFHKCDFDFMIATILPGVDGADINEVINFILKK